MMRLAIVAFTALVAGSYAAKKCAIKANDGDDVPAGDCTDPKVAELCYSSFNSDGTLKEGGCLPAAWAEGLDASKPDCNADACWCETDDCNAENLAVEQRKSWASMPRCYGGIAGANHGPYCAETPLYHESEYEGPNCYARALANVCVENNKDVGGGDGCGDEGRSTDEGSCTSHRAGDRSKDDSFDGTTNHCRWLPPMDKADKANKCQADDECSWHDDRGEVMINGQQGECSQSDSANAKEAEWKKKFGEMECEKRTKSGCFENNDHLGENDQCTSNQDGESCLAESGGDFCQHASNGVCSGDAGCEGRDDEWNCEREKHQSDHDKGPWCDETEKYESNRYSAPDCRSRSYSNVCVENNMHVGMGDGCGDEGRFTDEGSCTSHRAGDRSKDDSFDGTTNHCRWLPPMDKAEKANKCQADDECTWHDDRGDESNGVQQGECDISDSAHAKREEWDKQKGTVECGQRLKSGCFENNDHAGEGDGCGEKEEVQPGTWVKKFTDEGSCTSHRAGDRSADDSFDGTTNHCRWIPEPADPAETCATHGAGTLGGMCSFRAAPKPLTCSWKTQCCKWLPPSDDVVQACATNGAGTAPGMCAYTNGDGPPSGEVVAMGFEAQLFKLDPVMTDKCAMVASFRPGKGSTSVFGTNAAGLVQSYCEKTGDWKEIAEHIGHDEGSIAEYCKNFVPDVSAMAAFKKHSPGEIIAEARAGNFATVFPGLADNLFIVISKAEFGDCLFTASQGEKEFGLAICTCDKAECNNQKALQFIVNRDVGPMRLLQFLDGSLLDVKDAVNGVVDGLLDPAGKINAAKVAGITKDSIAAIMEISGMSDRTTADELQDLVQSFKDLGVVQGGNGGGKVDGNDTEDVTTNVALDPGLAGGDGAGIVGVNIVKVVSMVLQITLADGLDISTLSKADYDTVVEKYQATAAVAAGITADKIERVDFYLNDIKIATPTERRRLRRAEGEVTMKIIFKEGYTEADANTAAASFNAAVKNGTVGEVTVILANGISYDTTFESVEVDVATTFVVADSASSITAGVATTVFAVVAAAASLF